MSRTIITLRRGFVWRQICTISSKRRAVKKSVDNLTEKRVELNSLNVCSVWPLFILVMKTISMTWCLFLSEDYARKWFSLSSVHRGSRTLTRFAKTVTDSHTFILFVCDHDTVPISACTRIIPSGCLCFI